MPTPWRTRLHLLDVGLAGVVARPSGSTRRAATAPPRSSPRRCRACQSCSGERRIGAEVLPDVPAGERADRDRRDRADGRWSCRPPASRCPASPAMSAERVHVAGLALVGPHAQRRVALQVLDGLDTLPAAPCARSSAVTSFWKSTKALPRGGRVRTHMHRSPPGNSRSRPGSGGGKPARSPRSPPAHPMRGGAAPASWPWRMATSAANGAQHCARAKMPRRHCRPGRRHRQRRRRPA